MPCTSTQEKNVAARCALNLVQRPIIGVSNSSRLVHCTLHQCKPCACSVPAVLTPEPSSAELCFLWESQGFQDSTV